MGIEEVEQGMLLEELECASVTDDNVPVAPSPSAVKRRLCKAGPSLAIAAVFALASAGAAWKVSHGSQRRHSNEVLAAAPLQQASEVASSDGACGETEPDVDFVYAGDWFDHYDHIASQDDCCDLCREEDKCEAWTWVKDAKLESGNPGQCWMKAGRLTGRAGKLGVVSGFRAPRKAADHDRQEHSDEPAHKAAGKAQQDAADDKRSAEHTKKPAGSHEVAQKPHEEEEETSKCSALGASCLVKKCCKDPGHQCFTKDDYWAQCMVSCEKGPNPMDQVSPMPWACDPLGDKTPGEAVKCAAAGEDCSSSKCCLEGGTQCYEKNASFAQCKPSCEPGADMAAQDWLPWSCKEIGPRTQGAAPWVETKCAKPGADCSKTACCATPGHQCYLQSQFWGECKPSCDPGMVSYPGGPKWECTKVGQRTPERADQAASAKGTIGPWVIKRCSKDGENCLDSQCCHGVDNQCYTKNKYWAMCKTSCSTEPDPNDGNKTWDCKALGPRSWGLATKGYPSLFCISLYMPERYEGPLLKAHLEANAGIFQCDGYDVFAATNDTLGTSKDGILVKANLIPKIKVGVSQDGTAGNAKLFMALWDKVIAGGRFRNYDWTIKVDPDAVIIPWRIRTHMKPHVGKNAYVVNCNKFPGSPNFPMMFGAVEIFSNKAMIAYAMGSWKCGQQLPWKAWGEDYYMTHCLDFLGVGRVNDFGVLGDNVCTGANCKDSYTGSFHPFKDKGTWFKCWSDATA